ncbi:sensor histidine kinase [Cellulomonas rhizosphaerae]|uniref:sensor histidine kinase n=1 Tax=Cellulomonas rhizosphaerae TaxID=2293719 RepID=UPI001F271310|nr:ATP-binding protein [Cellulomonas rhizosphaerae]
MPETALAVAQRAKDIAGDRRALVRATAIVALGYAIGASLQSTYIYSTFVPGWEGISLWRRLLANVIGVVALLVGLVVMRVHRAAHLGTFAVGVIASAAVCSIVRVLAQAALDVYAAPQQSTFEAELLGGFIIGVVSAAIGCWAIVVRRGNRRSTRAAERHVVEVEMAVHALEQEEIRVRREVAEGLHGTLQGKLVVIDARIDEVLAAGRLDPGDAETLVWVRDELQAASEVDVRQMSRLLYPERIELGLVPAVRALFGRIPASIATRLSASDAVRSLDDPASSCISVADRLLAVRVVEEGVTNALKYGPASSIQVDLDLVEGWLIIAVENDGPLFDPSLAGIASGTARLRDRLELQGGTVSLTPGEERGARLEARLKLGAAPE